MNYSSYYVVYQESSPDSRRTLSVCRPDASLVAFPRTGNRSPDGRAWLGRPWLRSEGMSNPDSS